MTLPFVLMFAAAKQQKQSIWAARTERHHRVQMERTHSLCLSLFSYSGIRITSHLIIFLHIFFRRLADFECVCVCLYSLFNVI